MMLGLYPGQHYGLPELLNFIMYLNSHLDHTYPLRGQHGVGMADP